MTTEYQIKANIDSLPAAKQPEMIELHQRILAISPHCELWFLDGKDADGKIVSNPNIGYGTYTMHYAGGSTKAFYRVGISANTTGISVYIMGIEDKQYLAQTYGDRLGKATVTGYCIKFKKLKDIDIDVLEEAMRDRLEQEL
jgi:hypothetical protein